jgi:tRNA pseudouridine55 synthase
MARLIRTRVGNFLLEESVSLEALEEMCSEGRGSELLIPMDQALSSMPRIVLNEQESLLLRNGVIVPTSVTIEPDIIVRVHDPFGALIALGRVVKQEDGLRLRPVKVFSLEKDVADRYG